MIYVTDFCNMIYVTDSFDLTHQRQRENQI